MSGGGNDVDIDVRVNDQTERGFRDVNGRLRNMRGQFAAEGRRAGRAYGDGFGGELGRIMPKVGAGLGAVAKGLLGIGGAGGAVQVLGAVAATGQQLLPIALALPGALLGGAAAFATFKVATAGFGEALNAKDAAAFAEATKEMPAPMREAASEARSFKESFKEVQKTVQAKFWAGMGGEIKQLGSSYLPILRDGMNDVADAGNQMFKGLTTQLRSGGVKDAVKQIFSDTAFAIDNADSSLGRFIAGFIKLGTVGSARLPRLGELIDSAAGKWEKWVDKGLSSGSFDRALDSAIAGWKDLGGIVGNVGSIVASVFRGLGAGASSPLASFRELTARVAEFMRSVSAQEGLRAFGEMLREVSRVVGDLFMTALQQIAPVVRELSPVVSEVAQAIGATLKSAIETVGPILLDLARWMRENKEMIGQLAQAALVAWAAFKGYTILKKVSDGIRGIVTAAGGAGGPHLNGVAGALAKIAGVVGLAAVAKGLDEINLAAANGDPEKLGYMEEQLHGIVGAFEQLATNPGSVFKEIGEEFDQVAMSFKTGNSEVGKFMAWMTRLQLGFKLEPIEFDVRTGPAEDKVNEFMRQVSSITPTVNINGNTNEAGFALRTILQEIAAGKESVIIDGKPMPAQEALRMVMDMISNSAGDVTINGETKPAGQALAEMLETIIRSRADLTVGAKDNASSTIRDIISTWNGYTIRLNAVVSSRIGGMAKGGASGGGLTWVGERGPELVRAMASGGARGRGRTLVGERGPELVSLPAGSQVTPAGKTRAMLAEGDGGEMGGGGAHVSFSGGLDSAFATYVMRMIREGKIRITVGSGGRVMA